MDTVLTIAIECCGHRYRMPVEFAACPLCGNTAGRVGEPLEPDQWEADGVLYSDAFMPVEWAESRKR